MNKTIKSKIELLKTHTLFDAIKELSQKLSDEYGKGFSQRNLRSMRSFYLAFPIWQTVSAQLDCTNYCYASNKGFKMKFEYNK